MHFAVHGAWASKTFRVLERGAALLAAEARGRADGPGACLPARAARFGALAPGTPISPFINYLLLEVMKITMNIHLDTNSSIITMKNNFFDFFSLLTTYVARFETVFSNFLVPII